MNKIEKTDLRVFKTQLAIRHAFIDLLEEKEFKDIQAQEIIEKALINRSTFYKYYRGKNALATKLIKEICTIYADSVKQWFESQDREQLIPKLILKMQEQSRLILALWKIRSKRHDLYQDMETILKAGFTKYAMERIDEKKDWEYHSIIFSFVCLTSLKYYFEKNEVLPLGQLADKWKEVIEVLQTTE